MKNKLDFSCYCDYDYSSGNHSCNCGDYYCRCGTIHNAHVTEAPTLEGFRRVLEGYRNIQINKEENSTFFFNRIYSLRRIWDKSIYDVEVEDGYYGQEIGAVTMEDSGNLESDIIFYQQNEDNLKALVEYLLILEYGYILDRLEGKNYSIEEIKLDKIKPGNDVYQKKMIVGYEIEEDAPIALVLDFKILDGYHRYTKAKALGYKKVKVIIAN